MAILPVSPLITLSETGVAAYPFPPTHPLTTHTTPIHFPHYCQVNLHKLVSFPSSSIIAAKGPCVPLSAMLAVKENFPKRRLLLQPATHQPGADPHNLGTSISGGIIRGGLSDSRAWSATTADDDDADELTVGFATLFCWNGTWDLWVGGGPRVWVVFHRIQGVGVGD